MKQLNVQISDELYDLIRVTAFNNSVPMRSLAEELLNDGLRHRKAKDIALIASGKTVTRARPPLPKQVTAQAPEVVDTRTAMEKHGWGPRTKNKEK